MNVLGRGLDALIPKKDSAPTELEALDVLHGQAGLHEPVYRFHDEMEVRVAAAKLPDVAPEAEQPTEAEELVTSRRRDSVFWVDVAKFEPNPYQPRRDFSPQDLEGLAASIRERGMLQPLLVTKRDVETPTGLDVRYQLIAGERRWRAAKLAGLREVPVMIRTAQTPEHEKLELALIENIQREDLNPLERARAFAQLIADFGLMQKEVAERVGKSREVVANALRMLRLPAEMQAAIAGNTLTEGHARALLMLDGNPEKQGELFMQIRTASLTVRDAELAARALGGTEVKPRRGRSRMRLDPDSREIQKRLEELFGTRVKLLKRGEHGRIVVEFFSDEELRGILDRISKHEEGYV